ncbi:hypothetical protein ACHAWU_008659 [Discostella pseudostelligera]|uniref:Phytanoyl-CoA dioxygenase n=1 Tax=Discostella pseudostelligera TaxID=259834 RepID=A0ABD3M4S9_9STRA
MSMMRSAASYKSWARGQCFTPSSSKTNDGFTIDDSSSSGGGGGSGSGSGSDDNSSFYPSERCRAFDTVGYIHLPQFASADVVASMKTTMEQLVNDEWMTSSSSTSTTASSSSSAAVETFRTDDKQVDAQGRSDYFLDSATKIHYFAEPYAVHTDKNNGSTTLKEEYRCNKVTALNKAGHGLHLRPGIFHEYTTSTAISTLLRELGYVDPVVPQSMYIFKQGRRSTSTNDDADLDMDGVVTSHQDSTFLSTTPHQTCIGLWLALDDATINNGCLWVRPGSHDEGIRRQFVRNPKHFGCSLEYQHGKNNNEDTSNDSGRSGDSNEGDTVNCAAPQMIFRDLTTTTTNNDESTTTTDETQRNNNAVPWEGKLPENSLPIPDCPGLYKAGFVPLPCKAGDLLVFAGALDHLSLANYTSNARHTFQLHCVEGEGAGVVWSKENWLQYPNGVPFMKL